MITSYNAGSSLKRLAQALSKGKGRSMNKSAQMPPDDAPAGPMDVEAQEEEPAYDKGEESEAFMRWASENGVDKDCPHYQLCQDAFQAGIEKAGVGSGYDEQWEDGYETDSVHGKNANL
jgi:hypothetical protein